MFLRNVFLRNKTAYAKNKYIYFVLLMPIKLTYQFEISCLERKKRIIAKENLDITLEKFNIGTVAPIEYREIK